MSKFEKYKKNFDAIGDKTIAVEEYFSIESNEPDKVTMDICLFTYFFNEKSSDIVLKVDIKIFHKLRKIDNLIWLRSEVVYEFPQRSQIAEIRNDSIFDLYELKDEHNRVLEERFKEKLKTKIETELDSLHGYLFQNKTPSALDRGWNKNNINRQTQFAVNGLVDFAMLGANVWMANNATNTENEITDADSRNNANNAAVKAVKAVVNVIIAAVNAQKIAKNGATDVVKAAVDAVKAAVEKAKEEVEKTKGEAKENAKKLIETALNESKKAEVKIGVREELMTALIEATEAAVNAHEELQKVVAEVATNTQTSPDIINSILGGMALPKVKDKLTIQNIELDGAFRISYQS